MIKRLLIGFAISILITVGALYLLGIGMGFTTKPASVEIPVNYKVGWWPSQEALTVTDLEVAIVKSNLNMFNSHSLISYEIKGTLSLPRDGWKPYIKEIHISERNVQLQSDGQVITSKSITSSSTEWGSQNPQVVIEITPIIDTKYQDSYKANQAVPFNFTNEHKLKSLGWGESHYGIRCEGIEKVISLRQKK